MSLSTDEELKDERLCARFKTEEDVERFRAAFQKGQELIKAATGKVRGVDLRFAARACLPQALWSDKASFEATEANKPLTEESWFWFLIRRRRILTYALLLSILRYVVFSPS